MEARDGDSIMNVVKMKFSIRRKVSIQVYLRFKIELPDISDVNIILHSA